MGAPDHSTAVQVSHLCRGYETTLGVVRRTTKRIQALSDLSFTIPCGELFGLVGPNGAGKTTLIKILSTLLLPTSGQAHVLGYEVSGNPRPIRQRINVVFGGDRGLYNRLSGEDNLQYFADLYRVPRAVAARRIPELFELVDLSDRRRERVEGYSRGMKQRLHIARALINDPQILFLDEPTLGLDPVAARKLRSLINELRRLQKTILLTTHYMFEVDTLCDRVAVIHAGRLLALETPARLKQHVADLTVVEAKLLHTSLTPAEVAALKALPDVSTLSMSTHGQVQTLIIQTAAARGVTEFLQAHLSADDTANIVVRPPTLEDAYVKLVDGNV